MSLRKDVPGGVRQGKVAHPSHVQFSRKVTEVEFPEGILQTADELVDEFMGYARVLTGRDPAPLDSPYLQLAEIAGAYHARAREVEMLLLDAERRGEIRRGSDYYRFRTGSLRSFIEMCKRAYDLGSRRLSQEVLLTKQRLEQGEHL